MGVARLSEATVISPRSDYKEVIRLLAKYEWFHYSDERVPVFDPVVQELTVRAVRLFALADQSVKDLGLQLMPGVMDVVFRGVKIPQSEFKAEDWEGLLEQAEAILNPIADGLGKAKGRLQQIQKEEADTRNLRDALSTLAGFSADLTGFGGLERLKAVVCVVENASLEEFKRSMDGMIFTSQPLDKERSVVLVATDGAGSARMDKVLKTLDVKPLMIPPGLPQNPSAAYAQLDEQYRAAVKQEADVKAEMDVIASSKGDELLAVRELTGVAREMLDEARMAGSMKRLAMVSGYIPKSREADFKAMFGKWMVYIEPVGKPGHGSSVPTLMQESALTRPFQLVTQQQGTPGSHEVDPTPIVTLVFPVFFGMMFGDLGHGIILTLFALLIRQRGTGSLRQWGNVFLAAGISSMVFGAIFGEFFGFSLYSVVPGSALIEIVLRAPGAVPVLEPSGINTVLIIAILIGVAHLTTGLGLDVYEASNAGERAELIVEKIPAFTMYLSGVGFGLAFIGAGYSFDVLKPAGAAPLLGVPNDVLGAVSLTVVVGSMLVLMLGRGVAIKAGKLEGESMGAAIANGGMEVFERISAYLANTISYVRLAIMLLIHASLLLAVNQLFSLPLYVAAVPVVIFNILIIVFEVLIVYIQDLRLHMYEFFTKFYRGTGTPFKKIIPDRVRVKISWL